MLSHSKSLSNHPPMRGIVLTLIALLCFAYMDTTTKYLATTYNIPLIMAVRYVVNCLLVVILFAPSHGKGLVTTRRTVLVLIRSFGLAGASLLLGLGLQRVPVAETTAINFTSPLLILLLAKPLLGEHIGWLGVLATIMGFIGVLLIAQPSNGLDPIGVIYILGAMLANTIYQLLSRVLAQTEKIITLLFYVTLIGSILFGIMLPWFWFGAYPSGMQLILFLSLGLAGGLGHYLFTAAFRYTPASLIAPITYFQLIWAGLFGWIVFAHIPTVLSMVGMILIVVAGLITFMRANKPISK